MNDTIIHRGPDDGGEEIYESGGYRVGLAMRRLSILDLSMLGHQPMHSAGRDVSIVFNGEIYNFQELKRELDYPFVSNSDTEVVIAAYLKWGMDCVKRFNGMFAIALYDWRNDKFFLARDRIGKKPLYYWICEGNIVFASELKPIMACPGFPKDIRKEVIPRYLYHQYINAPDTIFEDVYKLEPGHILKFQNGSVTDSAYWSLVDVYHERRKNIISDYEEAKSTLKEKLVDSVRRRLISDVPLGAFLSGGYDSSLITAIAQSVNGAPLKTFSIGFDEEEYNEAEFAKRVSNHLGTAHTETYITEQQMLDLVESIPDYYDEPFADSSQIPTMLVSKLAKRDVSVVISGDAGDELFCGYIIHDLIPAAQKIDFLGAAVNAVGKLPVGRGKKLIDVFPFSVRVIASNRDDETKTQFGGINYIDLIHSIAGEGLPLLYPIETTLEESDWQRRRMLLDMLTYLPGDILCKVDRASMKYSLEARCPFLDVNVVEYSFSIDHKFKYNRGIKKKILKDLAYEFIPKDMLDRPKRGFCVPIEHWLKTSLRSQIEGYSRAENLKKQGLFDPIRTQQFIDDFLIAEKGRRGFNFSKIIWSFFVFQQWYSKYIQAIAC
jgi:asparagine synthase (glutamine-hydrolysing)